MGPSVTFPLWGQRATTCHKGSHSPSCRKLPVGSAYVSTELLCVPRTHTHTHTHTHTRIIILFGQGKGSGGGIVSIVQKRNSTSEEFSSLSEVSSNTHSCICSAHVLCPALGEGSELLEMRPQLAHPSRLPPPTRASLLKLQTRPPAAPLGWASKDQPPLWDSGLRPS